VLNVSLAFAEVVDVKYRGTISLVTFECPNIKKSRLVNRICYQREAQYMVIKLKSTYYHYCEVGVDVLSEFISAKSLGRFYLRNIKSRTKTVDESNKN